MSVRQKDLYRNLINNRLKDRTNRLAENVDEKPCVDLSEQGHNTPSQQPEKTTYIIRTGVEDKFKAEMKEEFNKIREEMKEQRETIQEILRISKDNLILTNQWTKHISSVLAVNETRKAGNMDKQEQCNCKANITAHTKKVNGKENMPQIQEVKADNITKNETPTNKELHQSVVKRKRELETQQNIPNKHFKAETEPGNIKFSEDYDHEMYLLQKEKVVSPPPNYTVPEGVIDFDLETKGDPRQHAEYARDTFQYYKLREATFKIPNYIEAQNFINEEMRAILIDWLVEIQESFELNHETLYTAVKITDLYLSKKSIKKEDLQLLGATACLIASKVDKRLPPLVEKFLYVCDDAYTREELLRMERKVLAVLGFDLGYPLSYSFLRRYGRVCKVTMPVLTFGRYILESSLLEYKFNVELSESLLAAATMAVAFKVKGIKGWEATLEYYSGISISELEPVAHALLKMLQKPAQENLKAVRSKYSHKVFHEVATIQLPETISF